ncbi:hypothetical protein Tco_0567975 [Tanacetum coccineum]
MLSPKYQAQSTLGKEDINSSSPKRVHFINTITIIRKEDEPKETQILKPKATESNDHNTTVKDEETVKKELRNSKTVVKEGKPSDIGRNDETSNPEDRAWNISHVMDFMILENVEANIDPSLSEVVFGWPFVEIDVSFSIGSLMLSNVSYTKYLVVMDTTSSSQVRQWS